MHFLEFKRVKKSYRQKKVLSNISFNVHEGEIFGLVGSSGGGKSTLLKLLIGMERVSDGQIFFEGKNILKDPLTLRKETGFVSQQNMLFNELSLNENAKYFAGLYGISKTFFEERFANLVSLLGLDGFEEYQIRQFSGGMQKRANILISLIHKPSFLILDEPTVGLDSILRETLWEYIHNINQEGTTILVTSHLLEEIDENCTRVGILKGGTIVALASSEQYRKKYKNKTFAEIFRGILEHETL